MKKNGQEFCLQISLDSPFTLLMEGEVFTGDLVSDTFKPASQKESNTVEAVYMYGLASSEVRTELVAIENGTLTGQRYAQEIFNEYAGPYLANMGDGSMLMHDNARPYTAHIVQEYIQEVGISVMAWPSRSPDLNPIEHAWDELGRLVRNRRPPPNYPQGTKAGPGRRMGEYFPTSAPKPSVQYAKPARGCNQSSRRQHQLLKIK
ncbi:uncharacterized protein LOC126978866 [Leptidea sinapis]|uniref:uncharacterized protein LOC126978866 n=1 Tax=Leptidea sinapis TaxID=189913 RepID=UPI0021C44945|nr:uncharacterized protein LOC126978866 [Leptidea sinapis]